MLKAFPLPRLLLLFFVVLAAPQLSHAAPDRQELPQLMLWVRGDDLKNLKDGDRVANWPDASGQGEALTSAGDARPTYRADAVYGHPGIVLEKLPAPKSQSMLIPLGGEWSGATVFVVGKQLSSPGWLETRPSQGGNLRVLGYTQLSGTTAVVEHSYGSLAGSTQPEIAALRAGVDGDGVMRLTLFANGKQIGAASDPAPKYGIGWAAGKAHIGSQYFPGAIAEVLVYRGALNEAQMAEVQKYLAGKYGLVPEGDAPKQPPGYPLPTPQKPSIKASEVTDQPVREGLKLWLRADELTELPDNDLVSALPNAVGGEPATSEGLHRPRLVRGSLNERPVIRFSSDPKMTRDEVPWLKMPASLQGSWPELTVIIAGRQLGGAGLWDSAPGGPGIRYIGPIQYLGNPALTVPYPFSFLNFKQQGVVEELHQEGQIASLTLGKLGDAGQYLATWADGQSQMRSDSPDKTVPVLLRNASLGTTGWGGGRFNGDVGEVLVYDRALTDAERQQTERYLSQKWGVPLRSSDEAARLQAAHSRWSLTVPVLPHTQSWLANTFSGRDDEGWVQHGMNDVTSLPDGTIAAISVWDERHKEIGLYKDGKVAGGTNTGGAAIANDGTYLYCAVSGYGKLFAGVRRLTMDGKDAPWPNAPQVDIGGRRPPQGAIRFDVPQPWTEVNSIAIGNGELYFTVAGFDEVRVYDLAEGTYKLTFAVKAPRKLAVDKARKLWIISGDGLAQYNADGVPTGERIVGISASALAVDSKGLLWVADMGARQQLIGYDISGAKPREVKTVGAKGGIFSGPRPGQLSGNRIPPAIALSIDPQGNFAVLGNVLRIYSPDGALLSTLQCTSFTMCWDFDPTSDGKVIYSGNERYDYVPGAPPGQDWKLTAFTSDARRFPELASGGSQILLRRIKGQLLRYTIGGAIYIHRQETNSDIFAPAGMVMRPDESAALRLADAPPKGRFAWNDLNGNGKAESAEFSQPKADAPRGQYSYSCWVDNTGDIWEPQDREGVRCIPSKGLSSQGVPLYDPVDEVWYKKPKEFMQVMRAIYLARTDTMLLTGTTWDNNSLGSEWWGGCGREMICYSDWKKPARKILWRTPFLEGATNIKAITVAPAANMVFAGQMETMTVFAYNLRDGKFVGIVEPDKKLVGDVGWIDIDSGIRAFTCQNGEVLLLSEEIYGQKQIVYRLKARK